MLCGEAEVGLEAPHLGLQPRVALRRGLLHGATHATVQVADELVEDRLLRVEVQVEGAGGDTGTLRDLHDRCVVVAELAEDVLGRVEQPAARVEPALRERAPFDVGHDVVHTSRATFSSLFTIFPNELRGSSSTTWNVFGTLKRASRSWQCRRSSSSVADASSTTNAAHTSPQRSSGPPITAASTTAGCSCRTASISAG